MVAPRRPGWLKEREIDRVLLGHLGRAATTADLRSLVSALQADIQLSLSRVLRTRESG